MSITRRVRCDECGSTMEDWGCRTDKEAREAAKVAGWLTLDRQPGIRKRCDICPECLAAEYVGKPPPWLGAS